MEENKKMNILVLGNSGAGKSTLIKAISGAAVATGVGESQTQKIDVYESETWPMRFIDTKGFEHNILEQIKTINQVKKYTHAQVNPKRKGETDAAGIDAVWYCVEGTTRRVFSNNIDRMNRAIKEWKGVPVFAVITKSYSEHDKEENIRAVQTAFAKSSKKVNLQKIIPVVAEAFPINNEVIVPPQGLEELCNATLDCFAEARAISTGNRLRMLLEQKRFTAHSLVGGASTAAVVIGAVPLSFADSLLLVPLETTMTKSLFKIYGIAFSRDLVAGIVGSAAITTIAKTALAQLKNIPNIATAVAASVLNAVVAGFFVAVLGEAEIALCEAIYTGKIDAEKIDEVSAYVENKMKESPVLGMVVNYITKNIDKISGHNAKDIFKAISESFGNKSSDN